MVQYVILTSSVKPATISKLELMNTLELIKIGSFTNTYMKMKIFSIALYVSLAFFLTLDTVQTEYQ